MAELFVWKGGLLPPETPRRLRFPPRKALGFALALLVPGAFVALAIRALVLGETPGDSAFMAIFFGLILVAVVVSLGLELHKRTLLREGTLASALVLPDRKQGIFRDAAGREHTVAMLFLPGDVSPGMTVPVIHPHGRPEKARSLDSFSYEIVPIGPSDEPPRPIPRVAPTWNGVKIPLETPRRMKGNVGVTILLGCMLIFLGGVEAVLLYAFVTSSGFDRAIVVVVEIGIVVAVGALARWRMRLRWLATRGNVATALVLSVVEEPGYHTGPSCVTTYVFDADGRQFQSTIKLAVSQLVTGSTVPVFYDPVKPERNALIVAMPWDMFPA